MATITETRQAQETTDKYVAFQTSIDYKNVGVSTGLVNDTYLSLMKLMRSKLRSISSRHTCRTMCPESSHLSRSSSM